MDYGYMIKRAWAITWNHKILWLFGFFIMSGGANYSSSFNSTSNTGSMSPEQMEGMNLAYEQFEQWLPVIIGVAVVLFIIAIVWWVFSIAANGALIHLANEAEEGREVRAGLGWRAGFHNWGRVFLIYLMLFLPVIVLMLIAFAAIIVPAVIAGGGPEALASFLLSLCCVIVAAIVVGIVLSFFITVLGQLGTRHAVLDDMGPVTALKEAWTDLRTRFKDIFLLWLITIGIGIAYGMAVGIAAMFVGFGAILLLFTGALWLSMGLGFVLFALLLIPNAIYSTYISSLWTVFYRRMTGRDKASDAPKYRVPGTPQPAYPGAPPVPPAPARPGGYPPSPPAPGGAAPPTPAPGGGAPPQEPPASGGTGNTPLSPGT